MQHVQHHFLLLSHTDAVFFILNLWQVDYDNHPHFKSKNMKGSKRGSPVRMFTNINPADVVLPSAEGYRYSNAICNTYWNWASCATLFTSWLEVILRNV